jgi:hypothetical protein
MSARSALKALTLKQFKAGCVQVSQLPGDPVQATALPYPITKSRKATAPHDYTEKAGPTRPALS